MRKVKIVSHKPPRHLDDFISLIFLKSKYEDSKIEFVAPQDSILEEYRKDKNIILVDVGSDYNPTLKNYDHHQDLNLPCSFILVIENEFPQYRYILDNPVIKFIDINDRYGFKKACEEFNISPSKRIDDMRKVILLSEPFKDSDLSKIVVSIFIDIVKKVKDYNTFIEIYYKELDNIGILEGAKERIKKEEEEFKRKIESAKIFERNGLKVVYSTESFSPFHYRVFNILKVDLIIERNSMNKEHTSIIKNTSSPIANNLDLSKVFDFYRKVFIHKNGFIAVIDEYIENIKPELIVDTLTKV